ncbi:MAG: ADP-ribosyl-[dinitrogen reductase] hydrolase [Nitrospirae bacterium]|nr:ADP-ribosyl-[dinitrogen reductase] hydrolase [Nitrospirota bacterium]
MPRATGPTLPDTLPGAPPRPDAVDFERVRERALGAYLGLAVGDALGATTEFMIPAEIRARHGVHQNMTGGGWLHLKPGQITDDTQMSLALGNALLEAGGMDPHCVARHYLAWMAAKPVDIGHTVRRGLVRYRALGTVEAAYSPHAAGNGGAMRNLPVVLATLGDRAAFVEWSLAQARVTHNHPEADAGTLLLGDLTRQALLLGGEAPVQTLIRTWTEAFPAFDPRRFRGETDGYVVHTARTVLHFFTNTFDFESCLVATVNQGGDADTNGALAGALAGAFYGPDAIPGRWLKRLDPNARRAIEGQVDALLERFPPCPRRAVTPAGSP